MSMPPQQPGPPPAGGDAHHQGPLPGPAQQGPGQPGGQDPQPRGGGTVAKGIGRRLLGVVVTILVLFGLFVGYNQVTKWWNQRGMADQVGMCVSITGSGNDVETEEVDCATTTFHYLVAAAVKSGESCPDGDYTTITTTQRNRGTSLEVGSLCLMPKLAADTCYVEQDSGNELTEGECSDPKALFKVDKVLDETAPDQCEMPDQALRYTEPARTYCLVPAEE